MKNENTVPDHQVSFDVYTGAVHDVVGSPMLEGYNILDPKLKDSETYIAVTNARKKKKDQAFDDSNMSETEKKTIMLARVMLDEVEDANAKLVDIIESMSKCEVNIQRDETKTKFRILLTDTNEEVIFSEDALITETMPDALKYHRLFLTLLHKLFKASE
ncbi:MAG: hypothetical protein [Circular genetic element sp.]|nr:MAG: hypothetical protein [Circular genetic element sp.]